MEKKEKEKEVHDVNDIKLYIYPKKKSIKSKRYRNSHLKKLIWKKKKVHYLKLEKI